MKSFQEILEETLDLDENQDEDLQEDETFFKVNDVILFVHDDVARANPGKQVSDNFGKIVKKVGKDYIVKLTNGAEVKVLNKQALSHGNPDAVDSYP